MHEPLPYNEPELLRQVADGSESAFKRLFDSYERRLYTYAYKLTASREATEDIVQDIFLTLWAMREKLPEIRNLNAYLHRSAHNACMRSMRNMARETLVQHYLKSKATGIEEAGNQLLSKEIRTQIQNLVDRLSPKQRQAFLLSREEGLRHEEIAQRMGIALNTVKTHLGDALKFLRDELSGQYGTQALAIFVIFQLGNV